MSTTLQGRFLTTRPSDHPIHRPSYPWCLDSATTSSRGKSAIYPSLSKAQTPLSCTHWKYLLYFPVLTSVWCKVSLWWIFCEGKREEKSRSHSRAVSTETSVILLSLAQQLSTVYKTWKSVSKHVWNHFYGLLINPIKMATTQQFSENARAKFFFFFLF